jgi:hypothetical protein
MVKSMQDKLCYCNVKSPRLVGQGSAEVPFELEYADDTGGKGWCSGPGHCKFIARKWTMYLAKTNPVHCKHILKFPGQFPCSVPGQKMVSAFTVFW